MAREQPAADLEAADDAAQPVGERARLGGRVDVERDEELIHVASLLVRRSRVRIDGADEIGDARDLVALHVVADAVEQLRPDERIDEVRRARPAPPSRRRS